MPEWWAVSRSPWKLCAEAGSNIILNQVRWGNATNFQLWLTVHSWGSKESSSLVVGHLCNVSSISESLSGLQMLQVVSQVESVVPLHGHIESLHLFGGVSATSNGSINSILSLEEFLILGLDLVDNVWGVDSVFVGIPVDFLLIEQVSTIFDYLQRLP